MLKKNKFLFLFLISFAIILTGVIEGRFNPALAMKGNYPSNLFRALQIKNTTAENYLLSNVRCGIDNAELYMKNPSSLKPSWKQLHVNADALEDVYLIIEPLACYEFLRSICTHNCLWFEFKQGAPAESADGYKTFGLVCSGQMIYKSQNNEFFLFQFMSKEDYFKLAYCTGRRLMLYKLDLSEKQKKDLFLNAINIASTRAANEKYHLVNNNCINNMFELVNTVLPSYQQFNHWLVHKIIFNPIFCVPVFNEFIFRVHGLIKEKLPPFEAE